ncbi:hypothetical protein ACFWNK_29285 [Streptomyces sp. NPDC058417]|uniref:hypothetical protein n=1 Tax=unclassified Streptomyces TaxID=2593676 RepID=UPI00364C4BDD
MLTALVVVGVAVVALIASCTVLMRRAWNDLGRQVAADRGDPRRRCGRAARPRVRRAATCPGGPTTHRRPSCGSPG